MLTGAHLTGSSLASARQLVGRWLVRGAALLGVVSGGNTGTPAALPSGYVLVSSGRGVRRGGGGAAAGALLS